MDDYEGLPPRPLHPILAILIMRKRLRCHEVHYAKRQGNVWVEEEVVCTTPRTGQRSPRFFQSQEKRAYRRLGMGCLEVLEALGTAREH